jgi:hypothetical protein
MVKASPSGDAAKPSARAKGAARPGRSKRRQRGIYSVIRKNVQAKAAEKSEEEEEAVPVEAAPASPPQMTARETAAVEFKLLEDTDTTTWTENAKWKRHVLMLTYAVLCSSPDKDDKPPTFKGAYAAVVLQHPTIAKEYNEVGNLPPTPTPPPHPTAALYDKLLPAMPSPVCVLRHA